MSHLTIEQVAAALKVTGSAVKYRAKRESWPYETESCRGGQRRLYPLDALPLKVRAKVEVHLAVQAAMQHGAVPPAPALKTQPAERVSLNGMLPPESFAFPARSGEPIQAGLPSPVESSPAATVAGGLPSAGGVMTVAEALAHGMEIGLSTEDKQAMKKKVTVAQRCLTIIKPILDWPAGQRGKAEFVLAQAAAHGETKATLYRWISRFQHGGFSGLMDKTRADKNAARVLVSEAWEIAARGCGDRKSVV